MPMGVAKKGKSGRPYKPLDWEKVKNLLMAGSPTSEILAHFDINCDTLYNRCQKENKQTYTEFSGKYKQKGQSLIRAHQYAKALGHTDKGDNTLLIWLGKQRLGQMEPKKEETSAPQKVVFEVNYKNDGNDSVTISPQTIPTTDIKSTE